MFFNYLKIAIRTIKRHKGYSSINMAGLALGMNIFKSVLKKLTGITITLTLFLCFSPYCHNPDQANAFSTAKTVDLSNTYADKWRILQGDWRNASQSKSFLCHILEKSGPTALSVAVVQGSHVVFQKYMGIVDQTTKKEIDARTVFRAASLSKPVFAYLVMRFVDEGKLDVDKPLYQYLDLPLYEYPDYRDLKGDKRYELITARIVLSHTTGFPNWRVMNPDRRLDIKPQGTNPKIQENIGLSWSLGWGRFQSPYGEAIFHVGREEGCDNYVVVFLKRKLGFVLQSVTPTYEGIAPQIAKELMGDVYSPFAWLRY